MKTCSTCGSKKPKSEFYKNIGHKDGLSSMCKICSKEYERKRNSTLKVKKQKAKSSKKWRDNNKGKTDRSNYHRQARNKHLTDGVCTNHPDRLIVIGKTMCKECLENKMNSYHKHKANGVCPNHPDREVHNTVTCEECLENKKA